MRLARVGTAALAFGVLVAVLSGCVVFQGPVKVKQKGSKPKAIVKFELCLSDPAAESACPDQGNSGPGPPAVGDWRLLVGLRVSKGAKAPPSIEPTAVEDGGGSGTSATVLAKNPSYTAELNDKAPRNESKFKYVGYSSEPVSLFDEFDYGSTGKFRVKLEVKDKLIGKRLKVRPVVGSYQVSDAQPASDPIDCGSDPFEATPIDPNYGEGTWRICIDSPYPQGFTNASSAKIEG